VVISPQQSLPEEKEPGDIRGIPPEKPLISSSVSNKSPAFVNSHTTLFIVVLLAVAAHVALYRWVRYKIHEGVILQFLRDAAEGGAPDHHHADAIAAHTEIPAKRVAVVCRKSSEIFSDPDVENSWRASPLRA
jgi:hypothetical protein